MTGKMVAVVAMMLGLAGPTGAAADVNVNPEDFKCLTEMTPVRGFYVDNLLGDIEGTLKAANAPEGAKYPPGSVVQLIPTEVMVKHVEGWSPETNDWEFFEINVSREGSKHKVRGTTEVVNQFGGNCFGCHAAADPQWDLVCEQDHGCATIPLTRERIVAIQQADPRCTKPE